MFELEKYKGMKSRHTCPSCGEKRIFVRYVNEFGDYLADNVGRCNREAKCGYHYPPRLYFADNPEDPSKTPAPRSRKRKPIPKPPVIPSFHTKKLLESTLGRHDQNPFVRFLLGLFRDDREGVIAAADKYYVGLFDSLTCFWQIDVKGRIRKGKLMRYNPMTGKRQPVYRWTDEDGSPIELPTYWVHRSLQKRGEIPEAAEFQNCFFGEHLLHLERGKTIGIVEAEKTALISSLCYPEITWIAVGAQRHLSDDKMQILKNRQVILYPDADAFEIWREKTIELQRRGIDAKISTLLEETATPQQKVDGYDMADFLIAEQLRINDYNDQVARYNAAIDRQPIIEPGKFMPPPSHPAAQLIIQGANP